MLPRTQKFINIRVEQKLQEFYVKTKSKMYKALAKYTPMNETWQEGSSPREPDKGTASYCFVIRCYVFVFVGVTCLYPNATRTGRIATALAHAFALFVMVAVMAKVRYISRK